MLGIGSCLGWEGSKTYDVLGVYAGVVPDK